MALWHPTWHPYGHDAGLGVRRSLELAHLSLLAGSLPVGALVMDRASEIIAEGRNRAYDPPGGDDQLQGSPIAHAEMNTLARIATSVDLSTTTLWSSHRPCAMCAAACAFTGVGAVQFIGTCRRRRHLQSAFVAFWEKRARYPRFKSRKKSRASAEYTRSAFRWREGQLRLAKMTAPLDIRWSRALPDGVQPSTVTVSRDAAGRWFVSILVGTIVGSLPASVRGPA